MQEVSWKPWATGQWFHREAYLEELIDVLHFWMNLVLVATDKPEELLAAYQRKAEVNVKRQETGYTGEKCPECGR
jgi:dimeric dUTPase (all-alpha-NTP-PPase superfamily)